MAKRFLISWLVLSLNFYAHAQQDSSVSESNDEKNKSEYVSLSFEIGGGTGILLAWDLDFRFFKNFGIKLGYGGYAEDTGFGALNSNFLRTSVQYIFLEGESHIEVGLGSLFLLRSDKCFENNVMPNKCNRAVGTGFAGYRYQSYSTHGFVFRAGYIPYFNSDGYLHRGGFSLGLNLY